MWVPADQCPQPLQPGGPPVVSPGFCWVRQNPPAAFPGYWQRPRIGQPCAFEPPPAPPGGSQGPVVREHRGEQPQHERLPRTNPTIEILGFRVAVPADGAFRLRIHSPSLLNDAQRELLRGAWTTATKSKLFPAGSGLLWPKPSLSNDDPVKQAAWTAYIRPWLDAIGIPDGTPFNVDRAFAFSCSFIFKHPLDGKDWCLRAAFRLDPKLAGKPVTPLYLNPVTGPVRLWIVAFPVDDGNWFQRVLAKISEVALDIRDAACDIINKPGVKEGAAAATGPYGAAAATAGGYACKQPPPAVVAPADVPPAPPITWTRMLPWILGGLLTGAGAFVLSRR